MQHKSSIKLTDFKVLSIFIVHTFANLTKPSLTPSVSDVATPFYQPIKSSLNNYNYNNLKPIIVFSIINLLFLHLLTDIVYSKSSLEPLQSTLLIIFTFTFFIQASQDIMFILLIDFPYSLYLTFIYQEVLTKVSSSTINNRIFLILFDDLI